MKLKKYLYLLITTTAVGVTAGCNSGSNNGSNAAVANNNTSANSLSSISFKCTPYGGLVSITDNIPERMARGTTHKVEVKALCKSGNSFVVTGDTKFVVDNPNMLTIDKDFTLKALVGGNTYITYSYNAGDKFSRKVTVDAPAITDLSLRSDATAFNPGETIKVTAYAAFTDDKENGDLDPKVLTWASSDTSIATVDNGQVKLLKSGSVVISAKYLGKDAEYRVNVGSAILRSLEVTPNGASLDNHLKPEVQLRANALFSDGTKTAVDTSKLVCTSLDTRIVKFSSTENCLAQISDPKDVKIYSEPVDVTVGYEGKTGKITLRVQQVDVSELGIEVDADNLLPNSAPRKYKITANNTDVTNSLELVSSDPSVLAVKDHMIVPLKAGHAVLKVSYQFGSKIITKTKDVGVGDIEANLPNYIPRGSKYPVKVNVINAFGVTTDKTAQAQVVSSNPSVINVVDKNLVAGSSTGTAVITISLPNDSVKVTKEVKVVNGVIDSMKIIGLSPTMKQMDTANLSLKVEYKDGFSEVLAANEPGVYWSTTTSGIVSVDHYTGVLKAVGVGVGEVSASFGRDGEKAYARGSVNVTAADVARIKSYPSSVDIFKLQKINMKVNAFFADNSFETVTDKAVCKLVGSGGTGISVDAGCVINATGNIRSGQETLQVTYGKFSEDIPVKVSASFPEVKDIILSDVSGMMVRQSKKYSLTLEATDGKLYDATSSLDLNTSDASKLYSVGGNSGTLNAVAPGSVKLTVTYNGKKYVDRDVQVLNSKIISTKIDLVDSKNNVADKNYLMPHKEYTIKVLSCEDQNHFVLPAKDCAVNLTQKVDKGAANLSGMKLTPLLAGEVILHDSITDADYKLNVARIRNPEYETNGGSFSKPFTKLIISDEQAGNDNNVLAIDELGTMQALDEQGRYDVYKGFTKQSGGAANSVHWLDVYVNETNRPVPVHYQVEDVQFNKKIAYICEPKSGGFWQSRTEGVFTAAEFVDDAKKIRAYQDSKCTGGDYTKTVWHNGDAVRISK